MEEDKDGGTNTRLLVSVRVRPYSQKELAREQAVPIAKAIDDHTLLVVDPSDDFEDILRKDRPREKLYTFDHLFSETATQTDVYDKTTKFLIDFVINGFNATVFAYGATGAGKTHTMLGTEANPGIMALTLVDLFAQIDARNQSEEGEYDVSLTYLEIYNENIRDLLTGKPDFLDLREDPHKGVVVAGISSVSARSADEVLHFLRRGNKNRTQEATGANEVSSRSHAVLQVFVGYRNIDKRGHRVERFGKLSMIDLAGSERAAETKNRGIRMIEGANINRSLLALGNCINALVDNNNNGKRGKYVNFRDSKLTRLLKDSLGGNCRTVMIANVSPASSHFEETLNTLKYASRARTIKTKVTQQINYKYDPYNAAINQLHAEIGNLRSRLTENGISYEAGKGKHGHGESMPPTRGSIRSPNSNQLAEIITTVETIFQHKFELRGKMLEMEDVIADAVYSISVKQNEFVALQETLAQRPDLEEDIANEMAEVRADIEALEKMKKDALSTKSGCAAQMHDAEEKLRIVRSNIPSSIDHRGRQVIAMMLKSHQQEMQNLDLELNYIQASTNVARREAELKHATRQLTLFEKIAGLQRLLLSEHNIDVPEGLLELYKEMSSVLRDAPKFSRQRVGKGGHSRSKSNPPARTLMDTDQESMAPSVPDKGRVYRMPPRGDPFQDSTTSVLTEETNHDIRHPVRPTLERIQESTASRRRAAEEPTTSQESLDSDQGRPSQVAPSVDYRSVASVQSGLPPLPHKSKSSRTVYNGPPKAAERVQQIRSVYGSQVKPRRTRRKH